MLVLDVVLVLGWRKACTEMLFKRQLHPVLIFQFCLGACKLKAEISSAYFLSSLVPTFNLHAHAKKIKKNKKP